MTMMRLAAALALVLLAGCSNKMDPKECDKLRGDAFDLLNKAQFCNTDVDCKPSDWPGCCRPRWTRATTAGCCAAATRPWT